MTARPIRRNAQVPDRNGKFFYTSFTSLSHISKFPRGLAVAITAKPNLKERQPNGETLCKNLFRRSCEHHRNLGGHPNQCELSLPHLRLRRRAHPPAGPGGQAGALPPPGGGKGLNPGGGSYCDWVKRWLDCPK